MTVKELIKQLLDENLEDEVKVVIWDKDRSLNRQEQVPVAVDGIWNHAHIHTTIILGEE